MVKTTQKETKKICLGGEIVLNGEIFLGGDSKTCVRVRMGIVYISVPINGNTNNSTTF